MAEQTAKQAYEALEKKIKAGIKELNGYLKTQKVDFKKEPKNWGYVGNLGHAEELLDQINNFLGDKEE